MEVSTGLRVDLACLQPPPVLRDQMRLWHVVDAQQSNGHWVVIPLLGTDPTLVPDVFNNPRHIAPSTTPHHTRGIYDANTKCG